MRILSFVVFYSDWLKIKKNWNEKPYKPANRPLERYSSTSESQMCTVKLHRVSSWSKNCLDGSIYQRKNERGKLKNSLCTQANFQPSKCSTDFICNKTFMYLFFSGASMYYEPFQWRLMMNKNYILLRKFKSTD